MEEIKLSIQTVLPLLDPTKLEDIINHLTTEIGVETKEDLKYVVPDDLPMLKGIQVRKIIAHWKNDDASVCQATSAAQKSPSKQSLSTYESPRQFPSVNPNWASEFIIPWSKFSKRELLSYLEKGSRPKPFARREMIRVLVQEITLVSQNPGKKALACIAQKMVQAYPKSFIDNIEGTVVGTGYDSITKQLQYRCDYVNRKVTEVSLKRKNDNHIQDNADKVSLQKTQDKYGCINFLPTDYPDMESSESQKNAKSTLKEQFSLGNHEDMEDLMRSTYTSQRIDILNEKASISNLATEWPFLFESKGMFIHFQELTGINIKDKLDTALATKGDKIMKWLKEENSASVRKIHTEFIEANMMLEGRSPELPAIILATLAYFGEKDTALYLSAQPSSTVTDIESTLPETPCLIGCGDFRLSASRYMLAVDGQVVNNHISCFGVGLAMVFSAYYIFNIKYPVEAAATLEFIQRCFVGINPDKGSKIEVKKKAKRYYQVHPKVLAFINCIADLEWRA